MPKIQTTQPRVVVFAGPNGAGKCRVKLRVSMGGHDVPADVVRRRYGRSVSNFFALYMPLADEWTLFDSSTPPLARTVAAKLKDQINVTEPTTWHKLRKLSQAV